MQKLFEVEVEVVNTTVVKGKLNVTDSVSVVVATGKSLRHPERRPEPDFVGGAE